MPISEARRFLNEELMPWWAATMRLPPKRVIDVGVSKWSWNYRQCFQCSGYETLDRDPEREPDIVQDLEEVPCSPQVDGMILNGVFEQSNDPFQLMRNVIKSLVPGGKILAGLIGIDAPWTSDRDKWRVTKSGALEYCKAFCIDEFYELPGYFYVLGTKE